MIDSGDESGYSKMHSVCDVIADILSLELLRCMVYQ
jgi:hypothetical protein